VPTRAAPALHIAFAALVAACALYTLSLGGPAGDHVVRDWLYTGIEAGATGLVWWRAATARGARRWAWAALAVYATLWSVADLGWTVWLDAQADPPFPNWTDGAYLSSYVFAFAGISVLLRDGGTRLRASVWLDGLIGGLAMGAVCAALFLEPVLDSATGSRTAVAVTIAYPVLDVILLCLVGIAFGAAGWRPGPRWCALGLAMAVSALGDAVYTSQEALGTYSPASWSNATWPVAMTLLAASAWLPVRRPRTATEDHGPFAVPAACAAVALALLVTSQFDDVGGLAVFAAAASLAASGLRAWLTHRENVQLLRSSRREALEDGLTGLPNRRSLMNDLADALRRGDRAPSTLVFFDLDGFKSYNDNFGHGAGDALLARLAHALRASTARAGAAYRLGGDEFCVLFDRAVTHDGPQIRAAAEALTEHGEGFTVSSSYGLVALPMEAATPSAALQLADERMYSQKSSRRDSARTQGHDLLMQVLREREPELEEHVDDVGTLAVAVGRELGLDVEALDEIGRAAALHDVGKIAMPEAILHKPGPLDDAEWDVMRQHTVIGERILAAAPSLRPVGRLVRASHERFDGGGYPDGLAATRIPLGARIISVCDAFDAMRQARPYAASMSQADALAELERCSGTQFDPEVVAAFSRVLGAGAGRSLRVA
jgi:two-component system cell cycle response regulator